MPEVSCEDIKGVQIRTKVRKIAKDQVVVRNILGMEVPIQDSRFADIPWDEFEVVYYLQPTKIIPKIIGADGLVYGRGEVTLDKFLFCFMLGVISLWLLFFPCLMFDE